MKIAIGDLSRVVSKELTLYSKDVRDNLEQTADSVADDAIEMLKADAPFDDRRGKYRKSFYKRGESTYRNPKKRVANREHQLTHLLEHGHAIRNGTGRIAYGNTRAFPHWAKAEAFVQEEYERRVARKLEGLS